MRRDSLAWIGIGVLVVAAIVLMFHHSDGSVGTIDNDRFASLVSGVALVIVIGGSMAIGRRAIGPAIRHAALWLGAMLILVTLYTYRQEFAELGVRVFGELAPGAPVASTNSEGRAVVTLRRDASGHFGVRGRIDGISATFMVDTGASQLTLTPATASAAGIDVDRLTFSVPAETANGMTFMAPVTVGRLDLGPLSFDQVRAYVSPPGALSGNLLGVNVLDMLESYTVRGDEMVLVGRAR